MKIKATLRPGQNGTKRLVEKYGNRLVCVRYRYDEKTGKRYTTVEVIEDEASTEVAARESGPVQTNQSLRLGVRIEYWESELREQAKAKGAIWRPRQKLWEMRYDDVIELGLESRVVKNDAAGH
jgi:hypothetical protein